MSEQTRTHKSEAAVAESAKELFELFNSGEIDIDLFYASLTDLAFEMTDIDVNFFIENYIKPQFAEYVENPIRNGYLLSLESSGSLLNQFLPYQG